MESRKTIWHATLIATAILSLSLCNHAQIKKKQWKSENHRAEVINYAKKYLVSEIETGVPRISLAQWLRQTVGKESKIEWEISDCGEQTGTLVSRDRDFPMCVEANAVKDGSIYISMAVQFGTFNHGITKMKPVVRSLTVGDEIGGNWLDRLSDLPDYLIGSEKKSEYPNPTGGVFKISGNQPAGFGNIDGLLIRTMDYDGQNKNALVESHGGIQVDQIFYEFRTFGVVEGNVVFETQKIDDSSFTFLGKLKKVGFDADGLISKNGLSGHLTKLTNDQKTAEADVVFDFVLKRPCKGCGQPSNRNQP